MKQCLLVSGLVGDAINGHHRHVVSSVQQKYQLFELWVVIDHQLPIIIIIIIITYYYRSSIGASVLMVLFQGHDHNTTFKAAIL